MSIEQFIIEIRRLAEADGDLADERCWMAARWLTQFADGLSPLDAWERERNPALRAL